MIYITYCPYCYKEYHQREKECSCGANTKEIFLGENEAEKSSIISILLRMERDILILEKVDDDFGSLAQISNGTWGFIKRCARQEIIRLQNKSNIVL